MSTSTKLNHAIVAATMLAVNNPVSISDLKNTLGVTGDRNASRLWSGQL
ncbi:MAG: hypothetical protein KME14_00625 [Tildeniella torsiva UHER 1998/13D]|nr:hypothetical protein [Tildeniella torsiva UHER 1998/13D]